MEFGDIQRFAARSSHTQTVCVFGVHSDAFAYVLFAIQRSITNDADIALIDCSDNCVCDRFLSECFQLNVCCSDFCIGA